jgi:hypothetical protein
MVYLPITLLSAPRLFLILPECMVDHHKPYAVEDDALHSHSTRYFSLFSEHASRRRRVLVSLFAFVGFLILVVWPAPALVSNVASSSLARLRGDNAFAAELPLGLSATLETRLRVWRDAPFGSLEHPVSRHSRPPSLIFVLKVSIVGLRRR